MCAIAGYTREEFLAMNPMEILDDASKKLFAERIRRQLAGEKIDETVDFKVRKKDGSFIYITLKIAFSHEKPHTALVIGYDITERKKAEEALQKYAHDLENANKELEAFNYSITHDLRQPLRALESFSGLLIIGISG